MQTYDTCKHSGIDWLGEIPGHWELSRIKYLFKEINERSLDGSEDLLSVSQYTGVTRKADKLQDGDLLTNASTLDGYKIVRKRQLVSNIMLAWNGSLAFSDFDGITSPAYCIYELTGDDDYKFFHYLFKTDLYKSEFKRNSSGVIESRLRLYTEDFFNIWSILPPIHEQEAIAAFLDEKCGKIDALVEIKSQQIEKLKELRQVKIHQAVTKGLDANVELKDSGIDWIGGIPKHWKVTNFKRILIGIKDGTHGTHQRVTNGNLLLSAKNIHNNGIRISGDESMIPDKDYHEITKNGYPKKNDLLITCVGTIGRTYVYDLEYPLAFQRSVAFLRFNLYRGNPHYFKFYIESPYYQYILSQLTKTSAQGGVYMGDILKSTIILPPLSEQKNIIAYLDEVTGQIDQAIAQKQEQIEKLKQYKQSLINEVVTGKVKVA